MEDNINKQAKTRIVINGPPNSGRCHGCGKGPGELKPYGKAGDPLVGDFDGALLIKTFREQSGTVGASWECRDCIVLNKRAFLKVAEGAYERFKRTGKY